MAELLDIEAAASRAGVSAKTIRRNVTQGRYAGTTRDTKTRKWLIPATSIDRYHDVHHVDAEPVDDDPWNDLPAARYDDDWRERPEPPQLVRMRAERTAEEITARIGGPLTLTTTETAAVLGISEYAVHQAIKRGELTAYPWGRNGAHVVPLAEIRRIAGA